MVKTYNELSKGTKERFSSMLTLLHKSGFTVPEVRSFTPKQLGVALGCKAHLPALEGYMRLIRQMSLTPERKEKTLNKSIVSCV